MSREDTRTQMNEAYFSLPQWIADEFLPVRDAVSILLDQNQDEVAVSLVDAIPVPANITETQITEFVSAKTAMIGGIQALITIREQENPFNSPEALAMFELAAQRRLQQ
jgi:hypothetical protein